MDPRPKTWRQQYNDIHNCQNEAGFSRDIVNAPKIEFLFRGFEQIALHSHCCSQCINLLHEAVQMHHPFPTIRHVSTSVPSCQNVPSTSTSQCSTSPVYSTSVQDFTASSTLDQTSLNYILSDMQKNIQTILAQVNYSSRMYVPAKLGEILCVLLWRSFCLVENSIPSGYEFYRHK